MVSVDRNEATLTAAHIVEDYWRAYHLVYGQEPRVRYMGNQWYSVNGQMVHRSFVLSETLRLTGMARQKHRSQTDKGSSAALSPSCAVCKPLHLPQKNGRSQYDMDRPCDSTARQPQVYETSFASNVIGTAASACEIGQPVLASSANSLNLAASIRRCCPPPSGESR